MMDNAPLNISSLVVQTAPDQVESVMAALKKSGICEIFFHDASGKIVVTIEGSTANDGVQKMKELLNIPGVLSANLAYSCYEDEEKPEDHCRSVTDAVPKSLKEDA